MAFNTEHISDLLYRYCAQEVLNETEQAELEQWLNAAPVNREMLTRLQNKALVQEDLQRLVNFKRETDEAWEVFADRIAPAKKVRSMRWMGWAAAIVLLVLGAGAYLLVNRQGKPPIAESPVLKDIAPGYNKAVLTLANGSKVPLDSAGRQVIQQGGTAVKQQGGTLQYEAGAGSGAVAYNTLTTPRGGQFQVRLPDGTRVWLNAESVLRYPTTFTGGERIVEVTGEAYFDIAKNASLPFKVQVNHRMVIEVLGTEFNVNAYTDEGSINTTLVTGRIKVAGSVIMPGQMAWIQEGAKKAIISQGDIEKATAWKNDLFNFEGATLAEAMRQIARWYDVDVVYEKEVPNVEFVGEMGRNVSLSVLMKKLEGLGVHTRLEGSRRLVITP